MLRFNHYSKVVCVSAIYLVNNGYSNSTVSSSYDRQVPIRYSSQRSVQPKQKSLMKFTYVIIGCGVSGSAALGEILSNSESFKDGARDILVIDSQRNAFGRLEKSEVVTGDSLNRVQCMEGSVIDMNLPSRELLLSDGTTVGYDNCLISVGTKMSNLELGEKMLADDCNTDLIDMSLESSTEELMRAVRSGQHVSLVGADTWGTISIASQLADYSKLNGFKGTISIITPSQGVMASSLPRYLSVALGKRLNAKGIELVPYCQVRYIGGPSTFAFVSSEKDSRHDRNHKNYDHSSPQNAKIGIYLSRVYDSLNTSMLYTDKVAVFPNSAPIANQGPPMNCTGHFAARAGLEVGTNGGFLVNRCMLASDGVYLSGEVANVRMSVGRGIYTGVDHAYHTGIVAGRNMAGIFDTYDHIPIYEASAEESDIHLTFVGHCSAAFETHGFWWKLGGSNSSSTPTSTSSSAPATSSSSSSVTSASSTKKDTKNGSQGLYESINQPSRTSAGSGSGSVPKQQTMGERITSDFFEFFGYKPIILQAINTKILNLNPMGKLNVKKITEENSTASLVKIKSPPPLGIGILFYIDNDIVVGILISGSPLSQQGINPHKKSDKKSIGQGCDKSICGCKISSKKCDDKKINETGTVETRNENLQNISYSEKMHERARSFIGKPLSEVVANIEAEIPEDGISVTDFRSGRLIRLQNLSEIAGYIVAPAVLTSVDEINSSLKPNYKKIAVQLPKPNYRYASSSRTIINAYASNIQTETLSFAPTIMQENVFSVGGDLTGTRADKLAAAYASGLRYGIEGPGSR